MKEKTNPKKLKILHGMSDIAGQGGYSVRGLRKNGEDATLAVWTKNPFGYPVDIDLKVRKDRLKNPFFAAVYAFRMIRFALWAARTYDVFHFHFSHSLLPFGLDLFWLKLLHKKILMEFHGDDIRYYFYRKKPVYYPYEEMVVRSKRAVNQVKKALKYADIAITHDEELRKHIPKKPLYITPLRMDPTRFTPVYPDPEKDVKKEPIVIVHAPSNPEFKGSKYVIASVEELKKKYDIEFILVEGKTQEEAFEIYKRADIIVDQLFAQTYGVFALEGMAMGKPVVGWISEKIARTFPDSMPMVSATIDTLTEALEGLVLDAKRRYELGVAGRKYVEDYHDYRKVAKLQMDIYQDKIKPMSTKESFEYTKKKSI